MAYLSRAYLLAAHGGIEVRLLEAVLRESYDIKLGDTPRYQINQMIIRLVGRVLLDVGTLGEPAKLVACDVAVTSAAAAAIAISYL